MPKYVTLDWNEYNGLVDRERTSTREARDFKWFRDQLIPLVVTDKDELRIYLDPLTAPLPPEGWRPVTNEQIVERIKEKLSGK